jgi:bile-acid 7alpha-dehydratase
MTKRDLETRIRILEDIEAIKKLRGRYWRCIREGLWDDYLDCFTDDAVVDLGVGVQLQGKKALAKFYKETFPTLRSAIIPQGHNPEIDVLSDTKATGKWLIDNPQIEMPSNVAVRLGSTYDEEYAKEADKWRIKRQRIAHVYRESINMNSL